MVVSMVSIVVVSVVMGGGDVSCSVSSVHCGGSVVMGVDGVSCSISCVHCGGVSCDWWWWCQLQRQFCPLWWCQL